MLCALILAGGVGSRFWPQSTDDKPKQFLKLLGNETMIQITYKLMQRIVPEDRIFIVTNKRYIKLLKEQIPNIDNRNIICEPSSKNTAPCILLSSLYIQKIYFDANVVCVSSDSYIGKEDEFLKKIVLASDYVEKNKQNLVTIGIAPTRPEINYGYIKCQKDDSIPSKVIKFIEKPSLELAKEYLQSKDYYWSAGMYIYNNLTMLQEIKKNMPYEYELLNNLPDYHDINYEKVLETNYDKCQKISIARSVIEKCSNVYVIPADIEWDDVGSWLALERYIPKDVNGNIVKGNAKIFDSHNNIIYGNDKKIVLFNADNLFCIDSDDVIIIGRKEDFEKVHTLKDKVNEDIKI